MDSDEEVHEWLDLRNANVMKRGEKDYAPDGTGAQMGILEKSRTAMYDALALEKPTLENSQCHAELMDGGRARITRQRGTQLATIGTNEGPVLWLNACETLYLVERGSLVCFREGTQLDKAQVCSECIQAAGVSKAAVYGYLKRLGYIVRLSLPVVSQSGVGWSWFGWFGNWKSLFGGWFTFFDSFGSFGLSRSYLTYSQIYRDLRFVCSGDPNANPAQIDFDVYKPQPSFRKSKPGMPDFYIKVLDARRTQSPTLSQVLGWLANVPSKPSTRRSAVTRLREGTRSIMLAVVDAGVVSFTRIADGEWECVEAALDPERRLKAQSRGSRSKDSRST